MLTILGLLLNLIVRVSAIAQKRKIIHFDLLELMHLNSGFFF